MLAGACAGGLLGYAVEPRRGAALAGVTGALVAAAGASGPSRVALRVASFTAVVAVFVALATVGLPWLAALAMAGVAVLTSVAAVSGRVGAALGTLGSLAYLLAAALSISAGIVPGVSLASGTLRIVTGALAGPRGRGERAADPRAVGRHVVLCALV